MRKIFLTTRPKIVSKKMEVRKFLEALGSAPFKALAITFFLQTRKNACNKFQMCLPIFVFKSIPPTRVPNLSPLLQKSAWSLFYKHNCTGFARLVGSSSSRTLIQLFSLLNLIATPTFSYDRYIKSFSFEGSSDGQPQIFLTDPNLHGDCIW